MSIIQHPPFKLQVTLLRLGERQLGGRVIDLCIFLSICFFLRFNGFLIHCCWLYDLWDNWKLCAEPSVHQQLARRNAIPKRSNSVSEQAKVRVRILSEDVLGCLHGSLHLAICLRVNGGRLTWINPQSQANSFNS